jgi:hypothetical protein
VQSSAAKVEADERKRQGKPGQQTADELINLMWYALFAIFHTFADRDPCQPGLASR